jgi:flagellin-like hook-associated protein FlgL
MQINHNIRAMVTQHSLFQNNNSMTKSLEKLSTGLRINRAQDDAAGLAMSEQMRTQIRGLGKAKENALNGQAALQIAEGGLQEITNLMQRQRELAIQSANDTLTSTERKYLNDEFEALTKEIGRIASTTDYNGKNMLNYNADPNKSFGAVKLAPENVLEIEPGSGGLITKTEGEESKVKFQISLGTSTLTIGGFTLTYGSKAGSGEWDTPAELADLLNEKLAGGDWNFYAENTGHIIMEKKVAGAFLKQNGKALNDGTDQQKEAEAIKDMMDPGGIFANSGLVAGNIAAVSLGDKGSVYTLKPPAAGESFEFDFSKLKIGDVIEVGNQINLKYLDGAGMTGMTYQNWSFTNQTQLENILKADALKSAFGTALGKETDGETDAQFKVEGTGTMIKITNTTDPKKTPKELDPDIGKAASYTLHIGANYSGMWGASGRYGNELAVTYKGLDCKVTDDGKWSVNIAGVEFMNDSKATLDITTQNKSTEAIDAIDKAIKEVSGTRAAIGTFINRLDYTVNNIANLEFNTQDAESRIRDTDFAKETTSFTRNQIMVQSSVSMLAQANSLPQAVLGLLG